MLVFIDTRHGSTFYIEVNRTDKVLDIKNKIESSQGIPVSKQALYYNGEPLLLDDLTLRACNIVANSRLLLVLPDNYHQALQPTEQQSLAPSTSFQDSLGEFQDWSAVARNKNRQMIHQQQEQSLVPSNEVEALDNQVWRPAMMASTAEGNVKNQESSERHDENQDSTPTKFPPLPDDFFSGIGSHVPASTAEENIDVSHTEQSTIQSNTLGDLLFDEDPPLPAGIFSDLLHTEESTIPSFRDLLFDEDPPLPADFFSDIGDQGPASNVFHTEQSTVPSNTFGGLVFAEDRPLSTEHLREQRSNQVVQTEKSQPSREVINVPDSPVKVRRFRKPPQRMRVMILPYSSDNEPVRKIQVSVSANENVEELRKELEKIRVKNELKLPENGYFFIHNQNVLDDDQSFLRNGVAHGDTIEIFPGYVTKDVRTSGL